MIVDPHADDLSTGWRLDVWGENADGEKGSGGIEVVPGRPGGRALRLHTEDAGRDNLISPTVGEGTWRERRYEAVAVWYRGDGSKAKKSFQVHTSREDGESTNTYSAQLHLGSTEWQRVVLRSFWRRETRTPKRQGTSRRPCAPRASR